MATYVQSVIPNNSTDAIFRSWISALHTGITTTGMVQTADTGQINFATVLAPAGISTYQGYAIYAFNDALQATAPFFLKIQFGSGATGATHCAIAVQPATGTDGAGNLTGTTGTLRTISSGASVATASNIYVSGSTSRVSVAMWMDLSTNYCLMFNFERSLDSSGATTGTGAGLRSTRLTGGANMLQQFIPATGAAGASEPSWLAYASLTSTQAAGQNLSSISGLRHAYGPLLNPELGMMVCGSQFAISAPVNTVSRYGVNRNYIQICTFAFVAASFSSGAAGNVLLLWE